MHGLYAIADVDTLERVGQSVMDFARAVLQARPCALQLRAKGRGARETLELLRAVQPLCAEAGVPLYANDRPDLAALAGCAGVHVGQEDPPVSAVREHFPSLAVGVSTHDLEQLARALADAPDYVAYGPVFATGSKERAEPVVGIEGLERAARSTRRAGVPLVAIGGITLDRASTALRHADAVAVIAALTEGGDVAVTARRYVARAAASRSTVSRAGA